MEPTKNNPSHQPSARHTEEGERFNRTLFAAIDALDSHKIEYGIIGGVAASGLGRPRSTHDIDVFVKPEDAEATLEALGEANFTTEKTDFNWLFKAWKEEILVDIIFKSSGDLYFDNEMRANTIQVPYHGHQIKAVSPEDLVIIKCAVHNEVGPHHWHDALAILSRSGLNWDYLLNRARRAPRRLLALLIYAQSNDILVPNRIIHELYRTIFDDSRKYHGISQGVSQGVSHGAGQTQQTLQKPPSPSGHQAGYLCEKVREALAKDERTANQTLKIAIEDNHILIRGETHSETQKTAIEEVVHTAVPGLTIENQVRVPILPGPESAEVIL